MSEGPRQETMKMAPKTRGSVFAFDPMTENITPSTIHICFDNSGFDTSHLDGLILSSHANGVSRAFASS